MGIEQGVLVTLGLFLIGLVYHAGRVSARLDNVERRVAEFSVEVRGELTEIKAMLRAAISERRNWRETTPAPRTDGE